MSETPTDHMAQSQHPPPTQRTTDPHVPLATPTVTHIVVQATDVQAPPERARPIVILDPTAVACDGAPRPRSGTPVFSRARKWQREREAECLKG